MNRLGLGLILAAAVAAAGAYWVSSSAEISKDGAELNGGASKAAAGSDKTVPKVVAEAEAGAEAAAQEPDGGAAKGKELVDGKWMTEDGEPTYNIDGDGQVIKKVDWFTYSGWRRYHAECHVCHGPNGEGSTFAPSLADSLKKMDYAKFLQVVSSGQRNVWGRDNSIMPPLGDNKNVMCYIDDIFIYLKARAEGAMPPGRLSADQRAEKPEEARDFEESCIEG